MGYFSYGISDVREQSGALRNSVLRGRLVGKFWETDTNVIIMIIIIYLFKVGVIRIAKKLIKANHLTKVKMNNLHYKNPKFFTKTLHNPQLQSLN